MHRTRDLHPRLLWFVVLFLMAVALVTANADPANPFAPDVAEPGSVEKIREYTTASAFLPASVAYVPDSSTVPSPTKVLGRLIGTPDELHRTAAVHEYFRRLAHATSRVQIRNIGTSEEGREILLALVSSEENLRDLDRFAETTNRLADPRRTDRSAMETLASEGRLFYYLTGGLHSNEVGSPEMLMELAYRLAVSEKPEIKAIREQVIVMITPVAEPDGRDRYVDWYYRHLRGRKLPYEEVRHFHNPPYWGRYAFHDNNRDGMQLTLALTRAINETYYRFRPQIMHDLHESVPLLHVSSGHGPYSRALDPLTISEWTQLAYHDVSQLQSQGLPGVWTWGFWDGWSPGYLFSVANNHNSIGRFYETFGNSMAETFEREISETKYVGKPVTETQWYRPWPPDKKITWSLRNNTNYMQAGVLGALHYAALHREEFLRNFWIKGDRAIQRGKLEVPHAWVFPREQRDRRRLAMMLDLLRRHDIELHALNADFTVGTKVYETGSYVVRLDQPTRNAILTFLEIQQFPSDEQNAPYDDVAWTWPLLYGVDGAPVGDAGILDTPMQLVAEAVPYAGTVAGSGNVYLLRDTGQTGLLPARVKLGRTLVEAAASTFTVADVSYPAGSWIVHGNTELVNEVAARYGLDFHAVADVPQVQRHTVDLPRVGVMHTWVSTQDTGWARYLFDSEEIPYTLISPDDLKRGRLSDKFDLILFPNSAGDFARILHGYDPMFGPLAYTKTPEYPSHGIPNSSPDVTGGMGFKGIQNLDDFVRKGGVLVTLANAGTLAVDGGLVRRINRKTLSDAPGSELQAKFLNTGHPISYGYDELTSVFRGVFPLFDVRKNDRNLVVMQFGTKQAVEPDAPRASEVTDTGQKGESGDGLVLSGFVKDPSQLDGKPAILDVPSGDGRVVLFSFNPLHRHLNHSDFRLVYNLVLYWNDLPRVTPQKQN